MKVEGLWTEYVPITLEHAQGNIETELEDLLDMIDKTLTYDTIYYVFEVSLYSHFIQGKEFANWLYDYSAPTLRDLKKELSIKIEKSVLAPHGESETVEVMLEQPNTFLIHKNPDNQNHVWSCVDYMHAKQCFLSSIQTRKQFVQELRECFENIFFTDSVEASFHTLNNDFDDIKGEIVEHLAKLDDYAIVLKKHQSQNMNNQSMCIAFKEFSGIDCSPQASRDSVDTLRRVFYNVQSGVEEELCCELHTKFRKHNRDLENQDRIYFHPGKSGIFEGKVIVIHIGTHQ